MRNLLVPASALLLLSACQQIEASKELQQELKNPLYAEWFYDDLANHMVDLEIQNDPLIAEEGKKDLIDASRREAVANGQAATARQRQGIMGNIVTVKGYGQGEVLFLENMLFFGPDVQIQATPEMHIYLTTTVDPRDAAFPDETAVDLGLIQDPYGQQTYAVPVSEPPPAYRTVVFFDTKLNQIYAFAQLHGQ